MKKTIEEVLAEVNAANASLVTERDELRTAFEALAAEKTTAVEAVTSEVAAKDAKLAELTVAIDGLTAERAELVAKIAALEGSAVSASVEAAKVCASVGVAPVESAPESAPAQKLGIVEQYLALSGAERTAFFMKHGAAIKAALR
jgi:seryl-tRNA synthetase